MFEEDGLPNMICYPCKYQLEKSYQFKKKCEAADVKLRKHMRLINQMTGEEDDEESQDSMSMDQPSSSGKSKQVKQLLADLVASKEGIELDTEPIEVTEEELVGGYILGKLKIFKKKTLQNFILRIYNFFFFSLRNVCRKS